MSIDNYCKKKLDETTRKRLKTTAQKKKYITTVSCPD